MKLSMKTPFHSVTHKNEGWFDDIRLDLIAAAVSRVGSDSCQEGVVER
jgi:hypothetical protein